MEKLVFDQLVQIFPYVVETSLNYHVHNSPQLVCVLTQMNLAHPTLLSLSLSAIFILKISFYLCVNLFYFLIMFPYYILVRVSRLSHACYMSRPSHLPPYHLIIFDQGSQIFVIFLFLFASYFHTCSSVPCPETAAICALRLE